MQSQPGSPAREQYDAQVRGRLSQEALERGQRVVRLQLVQIVDDQQGRLVDPLQGPQQPLDQRLAARLRRPVDPARIAVRDPVERIDDGGPEPLPIALLVRDGRPRRTLRQARVRDPGAQQPGLPAPGRRGHDRHAAGCGEPLEELAPRDQRLIAAARRRPGGVGSGGRAREQRHDFRAAAGDDRARFRAADQAEV